MYLSINKNLAEKYKSNSQKIRVLSEDWVGNRIFCPSCATDLNKFANNKPVGDFFCANCEEEFELKSKQMSFGNKIVDGAYNTMIERLQSNNAPNLFLLNYDIKDYAILNFCVIPKHYFIPEIIEQRKPLSHTAKRAGWVGCNILLKAIPQSGKIYYIKNNKSESKSKIINNWKKTIFLKSYSLSSRGWLIDILNCIDLIPTRKFSLKQIYQFEESLRKKHPKNNFIKDKIRQQLQILRDKDIIEFVTRGLYCKR